MDNSVEVTGGVEIAAITFCGFCDLKKRSQKVSHTSVMSSQSDNSHFQSREKGPVHGVELYPVGNITGR